MTSPRVFAGLAALALVLIWLQPSWTSCLGNDAAGCGLTQAFAQAIALGLTVVAGLLAILFAVPRRPARVAATGLMGLLAAVAGLSLLGTVQSNLRAGATFAGSDPSRVPPTPVDQLRRDLACLLAFQRAADAYPESRAEFEAAAHWFHGRASARLADTLLADPLALAGEEGARQRDPDEASATLATCADLEGGRDDDLAALLAAAGLRPDPFAAP